MSLDNPTIDIKTTDQHNTKVLMPCGSCHSCLDCTNWYYVDSCSWLRRMSEVEFEKHQTSLFLENSISNKKV